MTMYVSQLGSFDDIYRKYYGLVASIVRGFKFTDSTAEDLIQDIFIKAWQKLDSLRDVNAIGGWLKTIARNRCINEIRERKNIISISATDIFKGEKGASEVVLVADDIMDSVRLEYSLQLLTELIENHKEGPRAKVAKLFYLKNKSVKEISEALELNQNTVLSHLRRFRLIVSKAMIRLIEEKGIEI